MKILFLVVGILIFSGCAPRNKTYPYYFNGQGKVYYQGQYYRNCDCSKSYLYYFHSRNCCGYYRYMGPTVSCGEDGMCLQDELF